MPDRPPALLSLREAAEELNLSEKQVRRLIHAGDLPTVATTPSDSGASYSHIRIAAADIATFIDSRRTFRVDADLAAS